MKAKTKSLIMEVVTVVGLMGLVSLMIFSMPPGREGDDFATYHYREGDLVAWNRTRGVFYVEMETRIRTVDVDDVEFEHYAIGDRFGWTETVWQSSSNISNLTRTDP